MLTFNRIMKDGKVIDCTMQVHSPTFPKASMPQWNRAQRRLIVFQRSAIGKASMLSRDLRQAGIKHAVLPKQHKAKYMSGYISYLKQLARKELGLVANYA